MKVQLCTERIAGKLHKKIWKEKASFSKSKDWLHASTSVSTVAVKIACKYSVCSCLQDRQQ